jgi:hypothetical protein
MLERVESGASNDVNTREGLCAGIRSVQCSKVLVARDNSSPLEHR